MTGPGTAPQVVTVEGPLAADQLGVTLPHEHLLVDGWDHRTVNYQNSLLMELAKVKVAGGSTIVDLAGFGYARDSRFVRDTARRAGLNVILGAGWRGAAWVPADVAVLDADRLAERLVGLVEDGDEAGIRAGVLGPIAVGRWRDPSDESALRAAGMAQAITGRALVLSVDIGTDLAGSTWAIDVVEAVGADLGRVAVGRLIARPDWLPLIRAIGDRGCFLLFDCFGQDSRPLMVDLIGTPEEVQTSSLKALLDLGFGSRMLLSHGVDHVEHFTVNGGGGYAHILTTVLPRALAYHVTEVQVRTLTVDNPRRFLAGS